MRKNVQEFILINVGLILVALGIYLFKIPNNFATGGVSGISIIIDRFYPMAPVGLIMLIINIVLLVVGLIFIGFEFGWKTTYSSFALSGLVWFFERIHPMKTSITGESFLELIFAIMLPGIGSAIVFNQDASTGGTDIIAKILNKYTHIHIGKTLLIADFSITIVAFAVFGPKVGLYSIFGVIIKAFLIDLVVESLNISKQLVIISSMPDEIRRYILVELKRDATLHKAVGAYTNEEKQVITTVVNRKQAARLRSYTREVDQSAFIIVSNTSEIIGKGFRNLGL